jgi:phage shock protein PspC (stress-responsive transcriptional regulator)
MNEKRLVRMKYDRMFLGVASGVAHYLNVDPVLVRLAFVLLTLMGGPGLIAYAVLAIVLPEEMNVTASANVFDDEEIVIKDSL